MQAGKAYTTAEIKNMLSGSNLKATPQRIVIYDALLSSQHHPTAEQVKELIQTAQPGISLGTVYKTLDTFVQAGLANRVFSDAGMLRYDACTENHHHIYCTNTKEILDFEDHELQQLLTEYFQKKQIHNLKIQDIRLQIHAEKIDPEQQISIQ